MVQIFMPIMEIPKINNRICEKNYFLHGYCIIIKSNYLIIKRYQLTTIEEALVRIIIN